jgi:putative ABC transport system permease protein
VTSAPDGRDVVKGAAEGPSFAVFALRYAVRNLARHGRRTTLTVTTVLLAVAVVIIANRYTAAVMKLWQDGAADTGTGHAQLHAAGYWQKSEGVQLDLTLAEGNEAETMVRGDSAVLASVRRLELEGIVSTGEDSMYFVGQGVEPENERAVSPRLFTKNDEGAFVSDSDKSGVVIGKGLAESLKLEIGDEITLVTQTVQGSVNGIDGKVVGIVDAAIPSFSKRVVLTHIELLQRLIRMPGRYTELAVKLKPGVDPERWVALKDGGVAKAGVEMMGWWQVEPVIRNVGKIWDSVVAVITFLLFLSTALSVLNIIFMMVNERTVEIGTLMAIGARPGDVRLLFALEASLIGLAGGVLGSILGNVLIFVMDTYGLPFESPFGGGQIIVHPKMHLGVTLVIFVVAVAVCWLASIAPARKASRVEPVRAFRGQIS